MNINAILEMPLSLEPGEIMLYLDLHLIENMSPLDALKLSQELGLSPQLRYRLLESEGKPEVGIYALLHYERRPYDSALELEYVTDSAFEALASQIQPDTAVHFWYRLKQGRLISQELAA